MNIYNYLRLAVSRFCPDRLKILGLWTLLVLRRRMVGVYLDPVMACNLRCMMCYMSDPDGRRPMRGQRIDQSRLDVIVRSFFSRALKLQIGCATEPTLFNGLIDIISCAHKAGIPYIALTTNGQLLAKDPTLLHRMAAAGLNELTLSVHGVSRENYEELMPGARYEDLLTLTKIIADVKRDCPDLKLRVNFTVNSRNIHDLEGENFWQLWHKDGMPDIVQLRPVQKMGNTQWNDFDLTPLKENYNTTIGHIINDCSVRGISCIAPRAQQINEVTTDQDFTSALIKEITYCYISPDSMYAVDFMAGETFDSYHKRKKTASRLWRAIFSGNHTSSKIDSTKHLNYKIE